MRRTIVLLTAGFLLLSGCSSSEEEELGLSGAPGTSGVPGPGSRVPGSAEGVPPAGGFDQRSLQPTEMARELVEVGDRVFFGFDRYDLDAEARSTLDRQAALLRGQSAITINIEGHCDERGTREYNLALGERRANSVRDYLIALGIDAGRIRSVSYGEERPAVVGSGEDVWAQNRRAVTVVVGAAPGT